MTDNKTDAKIRLIILFEYCKRSFGKSDNPEMHFYVIPELHDTDNKIIKINAIHLMDENLVRGGVDDDGTQTFPWIRKITHAGMELVERLINESELSMPELHDELKYKAETKDRILGFIGYCLKTDDFPTKVLGIAKNIMPF
ncbi:MAG: hypothetical protein GKS07_09705 [Nitrosopumilus sp.]|nr:MAG: hypothetical protein GKS07_09705 [Nitrosopumilus sp.]